MQFLFGVVLGRGKYGLSLKKGEQNLLLDSVAEGINTADIMCN